MPEPTNADWFARASKVIPGGVDSPVRSFASVGGVPYTVVSGSGCYVEDVEGTRYVDFVQSYGASLLGHADPRVIGAITEAAAKGTTFGAPTRGEVLLAEALVERVPGLEQVRFVSSGTEATMSAVRVARGATGRSKILKFDGCYHGHADSLLVKAGSGALTFGHPDSLGVPADFAKHTIVLPYNDTESVKAAFAAYKNEIACIIVEPVPGNAGLYLPKPGYLEFLKKVTQENGALLIFDEVMTGFRLALGGAQERFGIKPDLTCLGKIIGGGLPVGAFGGRADIMDYLAPLGPVYQAGTLSGNPLAMAAGIVALEELGANSKAESGKRKAENAYARLEQLGAQLEAGMKDAAKSAGVPVQFNRCGSMFCGYFTTAPVHNVADAMHSDRERFKKYFHGMLDAGIYLAPSQFEAGFISTAHSEADIDQTVKTAAKVMKSL
jgi:glutamate-1-semialdehyde 2,1-aminomutase